MALPPTPDMQPFNFLGQVLQPAPAAKRPRRGLGENILRTLAYLGGAGGNVRAFDASQAAAQDKAVVQAAMGRLAANPNDQEAFQVLAQRDLKSAVEMRDALRPTPKFQTVGPEIVELPTQAGGQARSVFKGTASAGSRPREVVIAELLADPTTPPALRSQLERLVNVPVYQKDAAGNIVALPKAGEVPTDLDSIWSRMLQQESGGRQFAADGSPLTSPKGAIGIAQVMPGTAPEAAALAGLPFDENRYRTDPAYNEALGRAYFNQQVRTFGDPARAAAAYNAGPGAVRRAVQRGGENWLSLLPAETQNYVRSVIGAGGGSRVVDASAGFRAGTQNGLTGQFGPDGRFYPNAAPPKGDAARKTDRRDGDPSKVLELVNTAERILREQASGGFFRAGADFAARSVGASTESSRASSQLKVIAASMVMNMPRLEGPQSDRDVKLYQEMAGQVGDTTLPVDDRKAALQVIKEIHRRYPEAFAAKGGSNIPTATPEEARKLPKGSRFRTTDGRVMVVR